MTEHLDRLREALSDRYEILEEVGSGGMATVYLANDLRHQRKVAVKVLAPELAASMGPERFLREVRLTANLQHPHILPLFDSGEADGFLFYVMPYVEGETLAERLARDGELPIPLGMQLLSMVVEALASAHEFGVLHRDIKPDNILLSGKNAFVADFGVAKAVSEVAGQEDLTTAGMTLGTPAYMAPEVVTGEGPVDVRADIYSVGVLAYEILAGERPFVGKTAQQVLLAHVSKDPAPLREHRPSVSEELEQAVMKCLAKKPSDRWQSAAELLPHLQAAATTSGASTLPSGFGSDRRPSRSSAGRWPWRVAALVILVGAGTWTAKWLGDDSRESDPMASASAGGGDVSATRGLPRMAILPLENQTGDAAEDALGGLVQESAIRGLSQVMPELEVVPSGASANLNDAGGPGAVDLIVRAKYRRSGSGIRIDPEVVDARDGQLIAALDPVFEGESSQQEYVTRAAEAIAAGSAFVARNFEAGMEKLRTRPPRSYRGFALWLEGEEAWCRSDLTAAIEPWEESISQEPTFMLPHVRAAIAYGNGGQGGLGRDSILSLIDRSGSLTSDEAYLLSMGQGDLFSFVSAAHETYRRVGGGSWFGLAMGALRTNHVELAREAVDGLNAEFGPQRGRTLGICRQDWSAAWVTTAAVLHVLGEYERERDEVALGRSRLAGDVREFSLLHAAARAEVGRGDAVGAMAFVDSLLNLPADPNAILERATRIGEEFEAHGNPAAAEGIYARVLDWSEGRRLGAAARARIAFRALAPEEALQVIEEAVAQRPGDPVSLGQLALTLDKLGRGESAAALVDSIAQVNSRSLWPGFFYARRGDARAAVDQLRRAIEAGGSYNGNGNLRIHRQPELTHIADDLGFQAFMRPKTLVR